MLPIYWRNVGSVLFVYILLIEILGLKSVGVRANLSPYFLSGNWTVTVPTGAQACDTTQCCCFNGGVNSYISTTDGEIYFNGTVTGSRCDAPVKQDNIDIPISFSFSFEFFGIDKYLFTLSNGSDSHSLLLTAVDNSPSQPACSFALSYPTTHLLPPSTQPTPPPPPSSPCAISSTSNECRNSLPPPSVPLVGGWQFDPNTCASSSPRCCCLLQGADIFPDPSGAKNFFIKGGASAGCQSGSSIQDDFPMLLSYRNSYEVVSFLANNDKYMVTFGVNGDGANTVSFIDEINSSCSMFAVQITQTFPPLASSWTQGEKAIFVLGILVSLALIAAMIYCVFVSWRSYSHLAQSDGAAYVPYHRAEDLPSSYPSSRGRGDSSQGGYGTID